MSTFLESAACRGRRPANLVSRIHHSRSELLARLLRERRVARFLVAPGGFGKTSLAYSYADVVFAFDHVFWVNCQSPCFLRDLDADVLAKGLRDVDESSVLVVFEDVPRLDSDRAELFSANVDMLLGWGVEVLVTCAPSSDAYGGRHQDRLLLRADDLLLSEEEMRIALRGEHAEDMMLSPVKRSERIACLQWKDGGARDLMAGIKREDLPSDMLLALFVLLLFERGSLSDLEAVLPVANRRLIELAGQLEEGYPFLGVSVGDGAFDAAHVSVSLLKEAVEPTLESLAVSSAFSDRETLVFRLADVLLSRGMHGRAVDLITSFSTKVAGGTWLAQRGWSLLSRGSALSTRKLYDAVTRASLKQRSSCNIIAAWASHMLNDPVSAVAFAKRSAFRSNAHTSEKLFACVLLLKEASGSSVDQARNTLESLRALARGAGGLTAPPGEEAQVLGEGPQGVCGASAFADAGMLADLALAFDRGLLHGAAAWMAALDDFERGEAKESLYEAKERALLLAASWFFELLANEEHSLFALSQGEKVLASALNFEWGVERAAQRAAFFAAGVLERRQARMEGLDWCCYRAVLDLDYARKRIPSLLAEDHTLRALALFGRFDTSIQQQREEFRRMCALRDRQVDEYYETHPNAFRNDTRTAHVTNSAVRIMSPMMHVTLFGGFEVKLGDEVVTAQELTRHKVKALLAILVIARGREVARDKLAELLWPHSSVKAARKNLYSTWMNLVRVLTRDGSCPYLIRSQEGCRINPQLVTSDVAEFEHTCRSLIAGGAGDFEWNQVYARLEQAYSEDLLPSEVEVEYLVAMRDRLRSQLVDSLLSAARKLVAAGEVQGALWFAREALERDKTREDSYAVLMEVQIAADQRGAAIDTFFACKKMLADQLGIDPSPRLVSLYRRIIEVEEQLV